MKRHLFSSSHSIISHRQQGLVSLLLALTFLFPTTAWAQSPDIGTDLRGPTEANFDFNKQIFLDVNNSGSGDASGVTTTVTVSNATLQSIQVGLPHSFTQDGNTFTITWANPFFVGLSYTVSFFVRFTGPGEAILTASTSSLGDLNPENNTDTHIVTVDGGPADKGSISGMKWHDRNYNGVMDEGEEARAAWPIYIDQNNNGQADGGEWIPTDAAGRYIFTDLDPGTHIVRETVQPPWFQAAPASGSYEVTLAAGENKTGFNFGNYGKGSISGTKGYTEGCTTDSTRANWQVKLIGTDGMGNSVSMETLTDVTGAYVFQELFPGDYVVSIEAREGWTVTPDHQLTVNSFSVREGYDFNNCVVALDYDEVVRQILAYIDEHADLKGEDGKPKGLVWVSTVPIQPDDTFQDFEEGETGFLGGYFDAEAGSYVGYQDLKPVARHPKPGMLFVASELPGNPAGSIVHGIQTTLGAVKNGKALPDDKFQLVSGRLPDPPIVGGNAIHEVGQGPALRRACAVLLSGQARDAAGQVAFDNDVTIMMQNLLQEKLGPRVSHRDIFRKFRPSRKDLEELIALVRVSNCDTVYFFYSGLGYEGGIVLRDLVKLSYADLGTMLRNAAPDVKIIIDASHSGSAKSGLEAVRFFNDHDVTLVTGTSSKKHTFDSILHQAPAAPIRGGFFTWHLAQGLGNPEADKNQDGFTSIAEAFDWVQKKNPAIQLTPTFSLGRANKLMCPTIFQSQRQIVGNQESIPFSGFGMALQQGPVPTLPANSIIRVTDERPRTGDVNGGGKVAEGSILELTHGRQRTIELLDDQGQPLSGINFEVEIAFQLDPDIDSLATAGIPGIAWRPGPDDLWQAHTPTVWDPDSSTITAQKVTTFGQWAIGIIDGASAVVVEDGTELPNAFALHPNYPNPFNPETTIQFEVKERTHVRLTVFNVLGQQVAVLVNEELATGSYRRAFSAQNVPSGSYFYRMEAGDFVATRPMVLVK